MLRYFNIIVRRIVSGAALLTNQSHSNIHISSSHTMRYIIARWPTDYTCHVNKYAQYILFWQIRV